MSVLLNWGRSSAYNQELADRILGLLRKQYPCTLPFGEIKESLSEFSGLAPEEWALAIYALQRAGLVSADLVFVDDSYEPVDVISAAVTEAGRKQGAGLDSRFLSELPKSANELPTKRAMLEDIASLLGSRKKLSVLFIDLDRFKSVNDNQGHRQGDRCLDSVVKTASDAILGKGKLCRFGGDEFVVPLPNFNSAEAEATAERIRGGIDRSNPGGKIKVTASIGVACTDQGEFANAEELIDAADRAMYEAKQMGGNRVSHHVAFANLKRL